MITMESLAAYGADVKAGLARCMGMEDFYLRLVNMELADGNFAKLEEALETRNCKAAFEAAHALKGVVGNLALTPLYEPLHTMTERLRGASEMADVSDLIPAYRDALAKLRAL